MVNLAPNAQRRLFFIAVLVTCCLPSRVSAYENEQGPWQATGIKIGEVTDRSAIVWTRLTRRAAANPAEGPTVEIKYRGGEGQGRRDAPVEAINFPNGCTVADLREAVPGVDGDVRVRWRAAGDGTWRESAWLPVDPLGDFTRQFTLDDLQPATSYQLRVESRSVQQAPGAALEGSFRTAPASEADSPVRFVVATCFGNNDNDLAEGFKVYGSMGRLKPDFFVHTGDILYYDQQAKTAELARYHWQRMYGRATNVEFHRATASYFMKDDHDTWRNDCWPTMQSPFMHEFTFRQGQAIFHEQVPIGSPCYRTFRWGRHVQIWLVEGRDYRSPNTMVDGPEKTIWGAEQKRWFKETVASSNATFRILISPTPLVGPDRSQKADNHANSGFQHEGDELRQFAAEQKNMVVLCGDRHWQYMSVDPKTHLREYSCGPGSNVHAGGWKQEDYRQDMHRFLRVAGGFLSVSVEKQTEKPALVMRFHDVDGQVKFEDRVEPAAKQ